MSASLAKVLEARLNDPTTNERKSRQASNALSHSVKKKINKKPLQPELQPEVDRQKRNQIWESIKLQSSFSLPATFKKATKTF